MMFKKVRDILKILQFAYGQINNYYTHLSKKVEKEKVKLVLDHMNKNINNFRKIIQIYENEGKKSLLDTWIQFSPEQSLRLEMAEMEIRPDMSIDEVIKISVDFDDWLENYYRYLSDTMTQSSLKIVFGNLSNTTHKQKLEIVSGTNLLKDV